MNEEQLTEVIAKVAPTSFVFTDLLEGVGKFAEVAIVSPRYVLGAELNTFASRMLGCGALLLAVASLGAVLVAGSLIQRILGVRGITILSRLTGLILSALAAQIIMMGIQGFLGIQC